MDYARPSRTVCLMVLGCAFSGCHSIRLGTLDHAVMHGTNAAIVQAAFGKPITQVAYDEYSVRASSDVVTTQEIPQRVGVSKSDGTGPSFDLSAALRRAAAANPTIAIADELVRVSLARRTEARSLLLPTVDVGANLRMHQGSFMNGRGMIVDADIQSVYWGFGADAKGAGTVAVPGLRLSSHLADALYAPRAADQKLVASRAEAEATQNTILLEVGIRYFALVEAQSRAAAFAESLRELEEIERITANFVKTGQGRDSDAQRAKAEALLMRAEARRAEEGAAVAAAELSRLLDLDPAALPSVMDKTPPMLDLIADTTPLADLIAQAMQAHPQIVARLGDLAFSEVRVRQERVRPWLPLVVVGFSAGEFSGGGTGTQSRLGDSSMRADLDVALIWSLPNLGLGTSAIGTITNIERHVAEIELLRTMDRVRAEIAEAHAVARARMLELETACKRVEASRRAFEQDLIRAKNAEGRPLEMLASVTQLAAARQDLVRAASGYSQAQLRLYTALGNEPTTGADR